MVASIATVHGVGNACLHTSSPWRDAGSLPSDNTAPLTSFTQKLIVFLWMSKPIYDILGIEDSCSHRSKYQQLRSLVNGGFASISARPNEAWAGTKEMCRMSSD